MHESKQQSEQTPQMSKSTPRRLKWIDIAKGIAIILVVIGHTVAPGSPLVPMIFMFHMPLFFIMSGYTFRPKPMKSVVTISAKRLLVPYLLIFLIWQGITWLQQPNALSLESIKDLLLRLIFASGSPNADMGITAVGMAWFLMCLFVSRVFLNGLIILFSKRSIGWIAQALVFAILASAGIAIGDVFNIFLPFDLDLALVTVGFMWCGYAARELSLVEKWGANPAVLLIAAVAYILAFNFSYLELAMRLFGIAPLCILGALGGSLIACKASMIIENHAKLLAMFLEFMGRNSMLVYCFHCMDWFVPWQSLPALANLPLQHAIASALRTAYAILMTILVKRV